MKKIIIFLATISVIICTLGAFAYWRLSKGVVEIKFANNYLSKKFKDIAILKFDCIELSLNRKNHSLNLYIRDINLNHHNCDVSGNFFCNILLSSIIKLKFSPNLIKLQKFNITLKPISINESINVKNNKKFGILKFIKFLSKTSSIKIRNSQINLHNAQANRLKYFAIHGDIKNSKGKITIASLNNPELILMDIKCEFNQDKISLNSNINNLSSQYLAIFLPNIDQYLHFNHLSGVIDYVYFWQENKNYAKVNIEIDQVSKTVANNTKFHFNNIQLKGLVIDNLFSIKKLQTSYKNHELSLTGTCQYSKIYKKFLIDSNITVGNILVNELSLLWPQELAPEARQWIIRNISEGTLKNCQLKLISHLKYDNNNWHFDISKLDGSFNLNNGKLKYLDSMPMVSQLNALLKFNKKKFDIKIFHGVNDNVYINSGDIVIGNFNNPEITFKMNLKISSDLQNILHLINYEPLLYANAYNIKPLSSSGKVIADFSMSFPLKLPFDPEQITSYVNASIENLRIKKFLNTNYDFKSDFCSIIITPDNVSLTSKGIIADSIFDVQLIQSLKTKELELRAKGHLDNKILAHICDNAELFVQNKSSLECVYKKNSNNSQELEIYSDISKLAIDLFLTKKIIDEKGKLVIKAKAQDNDAPWVIDDFSIIIPKKWNIKGGGTLFTPDNVANLIFTYTNGNDKLQFDITKTLNNKYKINIIGNNLDLRQVEWQKLYNFLITNSENKSSKLQYIVQCQLEKINFIEDFSLSHNKLSFVMYLNEIIKLQYLADIHKTKHAKQSPTKNAPTPNQPQLEKNIPQNNTILGKICMHFGLDKNGRTFSLKSNNFGIFLKALAISTNVQEGMLQIFANKDKKLKDKEWLGKIQCDNFILHNTPFFARIFSIVFPTGLLEFANKNGLKFKSYRMKFGISDNLLNIYASKAFGHSLAILLDGTVDWKDKIKLQLNGTITPAYIINDIFANIPILGNFLSGQNHEGLFAASFAISGDLNNPKISSNPFSLLAPGLLRDIFSKRKNNFWYQDQWLSRPYQFESKS